ncbi:tetratricopeptide repeat-containing sensor histidine kinase [Flavobacterium aciduliphilum]|uniref:histidine kinase n=1 Tax=Flavobacterium aciduliphilum TaxID=1101402 RepID=A0A328YYQ2_9FLAO|nr:ATP-binding protein [Flavobacterium aciduliphilum]RAR75677.1 hypothetical protein CLV55_101377 [Flavobacterium aciduliphilum]
MRLKAVQNVILLFATLFCSVANVYTQSTSITQLNQLVAEKNIEAATSLASKINFKKLSLLDLARFNRCMAEVYTEKNRDDIAYTYLINAKKQFKALDSLDQAIDINIEIIEVLLAFRKNIIDYHPYLNEYINYAKQKNNPYKLSKAYMQVGKSLYESNINLSLVYFKKAYREILKTNNSQYLCRILQNLGVVYADPKINKIDSALYVYNLAFPYLKKENNINDLFNVYTNIGVAYHLKKNYKKALFYYNKADSIPILEYKTKKKEILYDFMSENYKSMGDYKKSLEYIDKKNVYKNIFDENKQQLAIKDIDTKYNTKQTKLENVSLKNELNKNYVILIIGSILLIITIIASVLMYKNLDKKKKIAEQEKFIQIQKLEATLKEQELHEIDVMLESQEKERQRIANELHDNIGSILATLKFNFQNIKKTLDSEEKNRLLLFEKTDQLLEEAYQEVRAISHLKNLGVVGQEGLEASVKKMAEKMSFLEKITFNVLPFGMTERIENTTEIMLFRIIQELCTNIIKHSEATEVNIYLTQHDQSEINIIIEDNGKGFDYKKVTTKGGIGLKSIEKKIEQMGGTITIDSVINNGTTIIIDLEI